MVKTYLEDKMFCNFNVMKKLTVSLVLGIAFISCASNKTVSQNSTIGLNAENVPEGILLSFDYIPAETTRIFIQFMEILGTEKHPIPVFTDIRDTQLEQLKETGKIICPFVQNGHTYSIGVFLEENDNHDSPKWLDAEITANTGIHTVNNVSLDLNDTQTSVILSTEPDFSAPVQYASAKYHYIVTLLVDGHSSIGFGQVVESGLSWEFLPQMADDLKKDNITVSGTPAFVTAYCNINYENLVWMVGIANTDEFTVSL